MNPERQIGWGHHFPETPWWQEPPEVRKAAELVGRRLSVVNIHSTVEDTKLLMDSLNVHHAPVVNDQGEPVGILCSCDLRGQLPSRNILACMTVAPVTIPFDTPAREVGDLLLEKRVGCVLVVKGNTLIGVLTRGDLCRAGLLADDELDRCLACKSHHHVRKDHRTGNSLCLECLDQARTWELGDDEDDPDYDV